MAILKAASYLDGFPIFLGILGFEHGYWLIKTKGVEYENILKQNDGKYFYITGLVAGKITDEDFGVLDL